MKHIFSWVLVGLMGAGIQVEAAKKAAKNEEAHTAPKADDFALMDTNKNGKVSKKEFIAAEKEKADQMSRGFNEEQAKKSFAKKDKDQDGFLTKEEAAGIDAAKVPAQE